MRAPWHGRESLVGGQPLPGPAGDRRPGQHQHDRGSSHTAQIAGFQPASPVGYGTTLR